MEPQRRYAGCRAATARTDALHAVNMLAILGIVTIGVFLALVTLTRTPVIVALVLTPLATALAGGFSGQLGAFALDGLRTVTPIAALIMFAVLYFGLMIDVGLFNPLIERLLGYVNGDPVRLCLATAALAMLVALDGDGATTFLISITALLPVHHRLGMTPLTLPAIVALAAGVMNMLPWGGPTARAMGYFVPTSTRCSRRSCPRWAWESCGCSSSRGASAGLNGGAWRRNRRLNLR